MLVGTVHGFADTVRFRGRGLIVDRAITTGHNRMIRVRCRDAFHVLFCARLQTCSPHFFNLLFGVSICARDANVVRYTKGHVYRKVTPHTLQTTILHGCFQEAYSVDWVGRSFFVFEHRCLRCFARACGVFIVAIGSY